MNKYNTKYFIKVENNMPYGTVLARKTKPHGGNWVDISNALGLCCRFGTLLSPPQNFVATDGATGIIVLNWDAVPGATSYRVDRSTAADFSVGLVQVYIGNALTANSTGLTPGVVYYYRLTAIGQNTSGFVFTNRMAPA